MIANNPKNNSFLKIILMIVAFRLLLDFGYIKFIYPLFEYSGFEYNLDYTKLIISWLSIFIVFLIIFIKRKNPLIYIFFLVYCINILPTSSYYALSGSSSESFWSALVVYTVILLMLFKYKNGLTYKLNYNTQKQNIIITVIILISIINISYLIYSTKGNYVVSFEDVYDYRAANIDSYLGIFGYLNNWTPKIFIPLLIAVGLVRKNKIIIIIGIVLCLAFFAFTGHKSVLLPVILSFLLSVVFKTVVKDNYFERFSIFCLSGLIIFSMLGVLLYLWNGQALFGSILFRRAFFIPVFLDDVYFDMFSELYQPIYWSNGLLSSFIQYPYGNEPAAKIVGAYLNSPNTNANTGFVASGFMNARYIGIIVYTFILISINLILLRIAARVDTIMFNAILLLPFLALFSSSDLPTTMLTHGLLIALITLYLYSGILKFRTSL